MPPDMFRHEPITLTTREPTQEFLDAVVAFGNLAISREIHQFQPQLPDGLLAWPGPKACASLRYSRSGKVNKKRSSKRHQSQISSSSTSADVSSLLRKKKTDVKIPVAPPMPRSAYGPTPERSPPLNLLTLPGEVRDIIYKLIAVHNEPMAAQLREAIKRSGRPRRNIKVVRRYPPEPTIALVNHQLRHEVLSMFYGDNKFICKRSEKAPLNHFQTTTPSMLMLWSRGDAARYLRSIELHLQSLNPSSWLEPVTFKLKRLRDGSPMIHVDFDCCDCIEQAAIWETFVMLGDPQAEGTEASMNPKLSKAGLLIKKDLIYVATELLRTRPRMLRFVEKKVMWDEKEGSHCSQCGRKQI